MNLREIDRLVAEKVMGWRLKSFPGEGGGFSAWLNDDGKIIKYENNCTLHAQPYDFWKPTTNIADAWKVVEKLQKDGWHIELYNENEKWCFDLTKYNEFMFVDRFYRASAEDASLAICLAALKAVGVEVEVTEQ